MSFAFSEKSPIQIEHAAFNAAGLFLVHHVQYAQRDSATEAQVILITERPPQHAADIWEFALDDYAQVVSLLPPPETAKRARDAAESKIQFKAGQRQAWQVPAVGALLKKGDRLRIPPNGKLRLRMAQSGKLHDFLNQRREFHVEDTDRIGRIWVRNQ